MDNSMEIYCEHCLITSIGQPFGPVDFSVLSLVITPQTMKGEIAISILIFYFIISPRTCKEAEAFRAGSHYLYQIK